MNRWWSRVSLFGSGLAVLSVLAAVSMGVLWNTAHLFPSPDETANYFFTNRFADTWTLRAFDALGADFDGALHPRSVVSQAGILLPGSFLGLPVLFGTMARVFGERILPLLTPILFLLSVPVWYAICRRFFSPTVARWSAVLYPMLPPLWYYGARSFMHNVPFLCFLIFASGLFLLRPFSSRLRAGFWKQHLDPLVGGAFLAVALWLRLSEIVWIIPSIAILWWPVRTQLKRSWIVVALVSFILMMLPLFLWQQRTYGAWFRTGYTMEAQETQEVQGAQGEFERKIGGVPAPRPDAQKTSTISPRADTLFPFGLHPRSALMAFDLYVARLFPWLIVLVMIGLPLFVGKMRQEKEKGLVRRTYLQLLLFVSAYLVLMYGSWKIQDNPDPRAVTIGNSYVRYWLPMYVLALPLAGEAIVWIIQKVGKTIFARRVAAATFFLLIVSFSLNSVFLADTDSLLTMRRTLLRSAEIKQQALALIETDAVVIVDRADKLFFPDRHIRVPLRDENTYALIPRLLLRVPVYYYGVTLPPQDVQYLNTIKLKERRVQIHLVKTFDAESLYVFEKEAE
ncbi:glycosyltransferase family 39 protein [Candidatus Uhrbacteria bacterium]|nr:glycosyltransferase family 39 protein [Candidatus Uhrbacteria bacterium]